jgi:poly-gamma-glutamate capsule biosynthesis protein CapA/YwtB (metallophosphatase superfamily)
MSYQRFGAPFETVLASFPAWAPKVDGSFTLVSTGDLAPLHALKGQQRETHEVWEYLRSVELAMVNLELPLTTVDQPADKAITLRADPGIAPSLREAGVDVVTVANNHALDHGPEGLFETVDVLKSSGIAAVGGGADLEQALQPALLSVNGLLVAVFGLASTLPPGYAATFQRPGIAPIRVLSKFLIDSTTLDEQPGMSPWVETEAVEEDVRRACGEIAAVRDEADLVAVQIHWGVPNGWCAAFQGPLADYQRPLGHALIEAGADLVVGHHPHTVHGVERYRQGLIAYSLGNFLFHSMSQDNELALADSSPPYNLESLQTGEALETVLLEIRVEGGRMERVRFRPARMNRDGEPEFLGVAEAGTVLSRITAQSSRLGVSIELGDGEAALRL